MGCFMLNISASLIGGQVDCVRLCRGLPRYAMSCYGYAVPKKKPSTPKPIPAHLQELAEELPLTLSLKEAANALKMHTRTVQRLISSGQLRAMRAVLTGGSRILIPRSELVRFLSERPAR
jgi:excisionase family DNA binding protein